MEDFLPRLGISALGSLMKSSISSLVGEVLLNRKRGFFSSASLAGNNGLFSVCATLKVILEVYIAGGIRKVTAFAFEVSAVSASTLGKMNTFPPEAGMGDWTLSLSTILNCLDLVA